MNSTRPRRLWIIDPSINYPEDEIRYHAAVTPQAAAIAEQVYQQIRQRRILGLMLGDTSMGMINSYFGPRLLNPVGFAEH